MKSLFSSFWNTPEVVSVCANKTYNEYLTLKSYMGDKSTPLSLEGYRALAQSIAVEMDASLPLAIGG